MKYRVYNEKYYPTYFKTKKEAVAFQAIHGGEIQRKIGCKWCSY